MVRSPGECAVLRTAQFEGCEPRIVLSAQALCSLLPDVTTIDASGLDTVAYHADVGVGPFDDETIAEAHRVGLTGAGQTVAVIDSGIAYDHPALGGGLGSEYRVVGGWDFTEENDADPYDDAPAGFHGTHVAGIIASQDTSHRGVAADADIVALRVFNDQGRSDFKWIESALEWVHVHQFDFAHPITTVNLSIGAMPEADESEWRILEDEFAQLTKDGIFISVAAGNKFERLQATGLSYPASSHYVVPVGSVDAAGNLSDFSQRDARMLLAPGEQITSTATDFLKDFNGITDDFFTVTGTSMASPYIAGSAMLIRQAYEVAGRFDANQQTIYDTLFHTADKVYDPHTDAFYRRVNLAAAIESVLPNFATPVRTDLGTVEDVQIVGVSLDGELQFELVPLRDGTLTVSLNNTGQPGEVDLRIRDQNGRLLTSRYGSGEQRVDIEVTKGQTYFTQLFGVHPSLDLRVVNLLSVNHRAAVVHATNGPNTIIVEQAGRVEVNGIGYDLLTDVTQVHVLGADQSDVELVGGPGSDLVLVRNNSATMFGDSFRVDVVSTSQIHVEGGRGQGDQARLYGSTASEFFVGHPHESRLSGSGFQHSVSGFETVYAFGGGGLDRAYLYGSSGDETFVSTADTARLSFDRHLNLVADFPRVYAYAGSGGRDQAFLHGSDLDDYLAAYPQSTRLSNAQQIRVVDAYDRVFADGGTGGIDRANLHGSAADDYYKATPEQATLSGIDFQNTAKDFDRVYAYAGAGLDRATLLDSSGSDLFQAGPTDASLSGDAYLNYVIEFEWIKAFSLSGGYDRAQLRGDAGGNDLYLGHDQTLLRGDNFSRQATSFDQVHAHGYESVDRTIITAALEVLTDGETLGFRTIDQIVWADDFDVIVKQILA